MNDPISPCAGPAARASRFLTLLATAASIAVAQQGNPLFDPDPAHAAPTLAGTVGDEGSQAVDAAGTNGNLLGALDRSGDPLVPIHTAAPDQGIAYGVWAAGPRFKVSFHDGATFVPMLGRHYPHNQPFAWHTQSVRVGAQELVTRAPHLTWSGMHAEYDLGDVVEAYDIGAAGVEQTFVIARRPANVGDLVIRGAIASELSATNAGAAHQALQFVDADGKHLVTYGAATAVDAAGNTALVTTTYEGGAITLRLDGAWLANAAFPLVVDPLLGPGTQVTGNDRGEVDIVHDSETTTEAIWIAYSAFASATDRDLYLRRHDENGTLASLAYTDITSSWSTQRPSLAYGAGANYAVCAFDRYFALTAQNLVRLHRHLRTDMTSNTDYLSVPSSDNAWRADVGGTDSGSSGNQVLVVWQQEPNGTNPFANTGTSDIYGVLVDLVAGTFGTPFVIANALFGDQERPSVNQVSSGAANNTWRVAFQILSTIVVGGSDDWDIGVVEVGLNASVSTTTYVNNASSDHKFAPMIEGTGSHYLVAFVTEPMVSGSVPTGIAGRQLRVTRLEWPQGSGAGTEPYGTVVLQSNVDPRLELGGLAQDRDTDSHWAILFRSNVTEILYLRTVGYRGQLLQSETVFDPAGSDTSVPGGVSYNEFLDQFDIAYANNGSTPAYTTMDRFAYPAVANAVASGIACSSAAISWSGSQQIGSAFSQVRVLGAASDSIHAVLMATSTASQLLVGVPPITDGCWLLVPNIGPNYVGLLDLRVGANPAWTLPLPEFLTPDTFYFQDFHTVGGGLFEFVSTQRLSLPITK